MKKFYLLCLIKFCLVYVVFTQTIELTFTANLNGNNIPIDSIKVENLTQGSDTMLYGIDTVLVLDVTVGMTAYEMGGSGNFILHNNYPNPFDEYTTIQLSLFNDDNVNVKVYDILGREITSYSSFLSTGVHRFRWYSGSEKFYFVEVQSNEGSQSIKMISTNTVDNSAGKIVYEGISGHLNLLRNQKSSFVWAPGDLLEYTGYATSAIYVFGSDTIQDNPLVDKTYLFNIELFKPCAGITQVTDVEGNVYNAIEIGHQCWTGENLRTRKYSDGTMIHYPGANTTDWTNSTSGAYAWFKNDSSTYAVYGALYNWHAVAATSNGGRNICPDGWHVPSLGEIQQLVDYAALLYLELGNRFKACRQISHPIPSCATSVHPRWLSHATHYGTDDLGFAAIPGDERYSNGNFPSSIGERARYWTSTEYDSNQAMQYLLGFYGTGTIVPLQYNKLSGYSVRCVKD